MNLYASLLTELNEREIVRTFNSPVGDYAEWLVSDKLAMKLEINSNPGYDAVDISGNKCQIKCRWERDGKKKRQLGVIRNFEANDFDYLIAIIFDSDFEVKCAYKIFRQAIIDFGKWSKHQNGYLLHIKGEILESEYVIDIKDQLI